MARFAHLLAISTRDNHYALFNLSLWQHKSFAHLVVEARSYIASDFEVL